MNYRTNPATNSPAPNIPAAPPKQPEKKLTVQVNITETDKFKDMAGLISNMMKDERISSDIRQEYLDRFKKISGDRYATMGKEVL